MLLRWKWNSKRVAAGLLLFWAVADGGGAALAGGTSNREAGELWHRVKSDLGSLVSSPLDASFRYEVRAKPFNVTTCREVEIRRGLNGAFRSSSIYSSDESTLCTRISWNGSESVSYFGSSATMPVVDGVFRIGDQRIDAPVDLFDGLLCPLTAVEDVDRFEVISYADDTLLVGVGEVRRLAIHFVSPEVLAYDKVQYFDADGVVQRTRRVTRWSKLGEILVPFVGEDRNGRDEFLLKFAFDSIATPDLRYERFTLEIPYLESVRVQQGTHKRPVPATTLDARLLAAQEYRCAFEDIVLARAMP